MNEKKTLLKEIKKKCRLLESTDETQAAAVADELVFLLRHYQLYLDPKTKDRWYSLELLARAQTLLARILPEDSAMLKQILNVRLLGESLKNRGEE